MISVVIPTIYLLKNYKIMKKIEARISEITKIWLIEARHVSKLLHWLSIVWV